MSKKISIMRAIMLFWTLFIGIGALGGGVCMLIRPDGSLMHMQGIIPYFQILPFSRVLFQDFIFPGISLLIVNCFTNLTAAYLIFRKKRAGAYLGCAFGVTLMMWITIQFIIFPANFMSTTYFIFGALQFICGGLYIIFLRQNDFRFDPSEYKHIGENKKVLAVFFSRLGYTKKAAYEIAESEGCELYEVTTPERTVGFLGFAWLGRFGMHRWEMPINTPKIDLSEYEKVIIISPIYVFSLSSPMRAFCKWASGKVGSSEICLVHFNRCLDYPKAFKEADELLGVKADKRLSITSKFGNLTNKEV